MNRGILELRDLPTLVDSPRVDADEVEFAVLSFWRQLFADQTGNLNLTSGFLIGSRLHGITRKQFSWLEDSQEAAGWVAHESILGRDLYQDGYLGVAKRGGNPLRLTSLFAELRADDLGDFPQPSIVVELIPGQFQCYWKLVEPVAIVAARRMMNKMCWEYNRPMRIPGTPNHRYHGAPVMRVTRSGAESYSLDELLNKSQANTGTLQESCEPVPAFGADLRSNVGSMALRGVVAGAAAAVAILGGVAVPDAISEPRTNIGAVSASFGFNDIRSVVFEAPERVVLQTRAILAVQQLKQPAISPRIPDSVRPAKREVIRRITGDFVEAADGIPVEAAAAANAVREAWIDAAESAWIIP